MKKKKKPPLSELVEAVDSTRELLFQTSKPTVRQVYEAVVAAYPNLVKTYWRELGERQLMELVSRRMKKCVEIVQASDQEQLPLPGMRDIPGAITYRETNDEGVVEYHYVPTGRSTDAELADYEAILHEQILADRKRLTAVRLLRRTYAAIFEANPGITVQKATAIWERENGKRKTG